MGIGEILLVIEDDNKNYGGAIMNFCVYPITQKKPEKKRHDDKSCILIVDAKRS